MSLFSFTRWFTALLARSRRLPRQARAEKGLPRLRFAPRLEILEDRLTPSTLTVLNNSDTGVSGDGSLRGEILAAHSGDAIVFAPSVHAITLTSGALDVTTSLVIQGPGAAKLTISGHGASGVFAISSGMSVTLAGLTITDGQAITGGGIDNAGFLTLNNCTLSANQSTGSATAPTETSPEGGGAILNEVGATLILDHSTLTGNTANAFSNTVDVFGGGLLNQGSATVVSCTFSGNQATGGGGGSFFAGSCGGAIDNFGGGTLTATASTFTGNEALASGADDFGIGGAIENNAGLDAAHPSAATIDKCVFTGNVAGGDVGTLGNGGAIDNEGTGSILTLNSSTVRLNKSGESAINGSIGLGGGLFTYSGSTTTVLDSTISANLAVAGPGEYANGGGIAVQNATMYLFSSAVIGNQSLGGAGATGIGTAVGEGVGGGIVNTSSMLTIVDSTIANNQAIGGANGTATNQQSETGAALGGGIENFPGSTLTLLDSTVSGNVARGGSSNAGVGGIALGGGIHNQSSTVTISGSTVVNNHAIGGNGGSGFEGGLAGGGGLETSENPGPPSGGPASASVIDSVFSGNQAIGGNGGSGANGGDAVGGGINVGFLLGGLTDNSVLTLTDSTLHNNLVQGGKGGSGGNGGNGQGGGLALQANAGGTVNDSTITQNQADGGAKGAGGSNGQGKGGGVYNLGTFIFDALTVIKGNHASTSNNDVFP